MTPSSIPPSPPGRAPGWRERADPFLRQFLKAFHAYATWLVSISWKRFAVLSLLLLILAAIVQSLPPFSYKVTEWVDEPIELPELPELPEVPKPPTPPAKPPVILIEKPSTSASGAREAVDISIDERGIRIRSRKPADSASGASDGGGEVSVNLPSSAAHEAVQEAKREAEQAARDAQQAARQAVEEARRALKEAGLTAGATRKVKKTRTVQWGDFLGELAMIWIVSSILIKATYKGRLQAEVKAAQATETAEAEALKRQVVEARMAAMQAQIEPHFLFNTLASIDHLIETDPPRASVMQKNLIALLRASMPTMRETQDSRAPRDLGRELAVVRPYLEILKVRMEERLSTVIDVPEGLLSAEFPAMMIQTLVENAVKHGLEPKPEGGTLRVKAEIVHGKLAVSVADTGLGFGKAPTAGTGVGLANIRERLQLLYGSQGGFTVTENQPSGTIITVSVPYRTLAPGAAA